jgi:hypothetical protein
MRPEFRIYRNLHKDCFSIQKWNPEKKDYRLHSHETNLVAYNVEFKVSQSGRNSVLKNKQKNVHAFVCCDQYSAFNDTEFTLGEEILYDPYINDHFVIKNSNTRVDRIQCLIMQNNKCYISVNKN